eukprot:4635562-Pleurochrysis_carterae.AAC.1
MEADRTYCSGRHTRFSFICAGPRVGNNPFSRIVDQSREWSKISQNHLFYRMDGNSCSFLRIYMDIQLFSRMNITATDPGNKPFCRIVCHSQ